MTQVHQPKSEADIAEIVRAGQTLEIKGGGTRSGLGPAIDADAVLSTQSLSGVTSYDPGALNIVVAAGTPVETVVSTLAAEGQYLPFEPVDHRFLLGSSGAPSIGAIVAGNISGSRRILTGACRDSLIGVRFVNGVGEAISNGGRVMKNVTGYDLVKLLCGSWGTLGVLTEVSFKVLPKPERATTLQIDGLDISQAVQAMAAALSSPFEVSGAAHEPGPDSRTYIRVEGFDAQVDYRIGKLKTLIGGDEALIEGDAHCDLWCKIRNAKAFAGDDRSVWRISVPPSEAPRFVEAIGAKTNANMLLDWGGGLIWASLDAHLGAAPIQSAIDQAGGHATLTRGNESLRGSVNVLRPDGPRIAALEDALRRKFDPNGILNPGRMAA
jgi:glycolate oxidase FAD binding subunit